MIPVAINGHDISMELDTGTTVPVISEEICNSSPLENSQLKLKTYTGEHLKMKGQALVDVCFNGQSVKLPPQVTEGNGPPFHGRNWLRTLKLNWGTIKRVTTDIETVLNQQIEVFNDELATLRGVKVKVYIKQGSDPKFFKPRLTSHALKQGIEKGLDRLENMTVMEKVHNSE